MDVILLVRVVAALAWGGIAFLIFLLWRIARFYERSSGQRAYAWVFLIPLALLPAGAAWYLAVAPEFVGLPAADALLFTGGVILLVGTFILKRAMMGRSR